MSSYGETLERPTLGERCKPGTEKHQKDKTDTALNPRTEKRLQEKTSKL